MSRIEFDDSLPDVTNPLCHECPRCLTPISNSPIYRDEECTKPAYQGSLYTVNRRGILFSAYLKCGHCGEVSGGETWMVRFNQQ